MPKEYVYGPKAFLSSGDAKYTCANPEAEFAATVGWSRLDNGGVVQLATIRNGQEQSFEPEHGLYMELDRVGINDLIRLLRRARDQAFGRDE